jgi:hypothetical protein
MPRPDIRPVPAVSTLLGRENIPILMRYFAQDRSTRSAEDGPDDFQSQREVDGKGLLDSLMTTARLNKTLLDPSGPTFTVASDSWLDSIPSKYSDSGSTTLPPLLLFLARLTPDALQSFDEDIGLVKSRSQDPIHTTGFLAAGRHADDARVDQWHSGLAELAVVSSIVRKLPSCAVSVEPSLPSGRADIAVILDNRPIWIEITMKVTPRDERYGVNDQGGVQVVSGDLDCDTRRTFLKLFDKIAGSKDRSGGQLHPENPSLIVLIDGSPTTLGLLSGGADAAIRYLLDPVRNIDSFAIHLRNKVLAEQYQAGAEAALRATEMLSAVALLDYNGRLVGLTLNAAADDKHLLTQLEADALGPLVTCDRLWFGR